MPADAAIPFPDRSGPLTPVLYRVEQRWAESPDAVTLALGPVDGPVGPYLAGQFNMLSAIGVGEVPVSVSGDPDQGGPLEHTVRDVGPTTAALCRLPVGGLVGVRGPFGTAWGVDRIDPDRDVIVVAGGIGLAPLRGAVQQLLRRTHDGRGRVMVFVGARRPDQILFGRNLEGWRTAGAEVSVTVDAADPSWRGHVGVVTALLDAARFDAATAAALVCGPEIMIRFACRALMDRGLSPGRIRVSLERNMQCGVGWCGHCQLGPYLLCLDGPVRCWSDVGRLVAVREL